MTVARIALETFEVGAQFRSALIAKVAIFLQGLVDDVFEFGGDRGSAARAQWEQLCRMESKTKPVVSPRKGSVPVGHLVKHGAKGEKIGASVQFLAAHLLRRHVGHRAHGGPGVVTSSFSCKREKVSLSGHRRGWPTGAQDLGEAKIEDLGLAALGDEDVRRLDVAVDDALGVSGIERVSDLGGRIFEQFVCAEAGRRAVLEGLTFEQLHGNEGWPSLLANVVDGADIGMIER